LITNKISFTFVALNNEKYTIGKYIGKEKTIEINKASDIYINGDEKEMSLTLLHEYMHAFQHQTMGNDFADYSFTLNAEFEAYYFEYLYVVSGNMIDDFKKYETSELYDAINAYETNQTEENYQVALKALKDLGYTCNGNSKYNNYTTNVDKIFKNK
jgi:Zn-dependent peptidase ImmA (M78 family)